MNKNKIIARINKLNKIKSIVKISKFDTINKLMNLKVVKEHHYEIADISKQVINFCKKPNIIFKNLEHKIYKSNTNTLWIFVTISSTIINFSYNNLEQIIKKNWKNNDTIIVIGFPAINFAKKNNYNTIASFNSIDKISNNVSSIITKSILYNECSIVKIVAKTTKILTKPFILYPFESDNQNDLKYKKIKFYYSLSNIINNISNCYINNILIGIFQETYWCIYQEKLINHEKAIKNIEKRVEKLNIILNKLNRKQEIEEMLHINRISKER